MAFTSESLNWALICMHDVTWERVAAVTDHFADASFAKTLHVYIRCGDVMTFQSLTLTPFCFEKSSVKKGYLMFKQRFQHGFAEIR